MEDVSALGSSIDGGRSVTSTRNSMAGSMDGGLSLAGEDDGRGSSRRVSCGSDFKGGGRYHLINQLVISSPSRGGSIDDAGIDVEDRSGNPLRERVGTTPQRLSGGRKTPSRTLNTLPKPGTPNVPVTSTRPAAASQSDPPPRIAVGPTVLVVDERRSLEDGDTAKVAGGDTPAYRGTSTFKIHEVSPSRSPTNSRAGPSSEAKATEVNFHVHGDGGLGSTPTSSSSSVSTVVAGDDARYRLASPVTGGG